MFRYLLVAFTAAMAMSLTFGHPTAQTLLPYPIVYVKAPRDASRPGRFSEVFRPFTMEPNSDLVLLNPDGREEILVDAPPTGAVADPFVSFDAQWVYYSLFPDVVSMNDNPAFITRTGSDIWKVNIRTRQAVQLTHGEWTPNAAGPPVPPYGVQNMGPTPLAGGRLAFSSNRNGLEPPKGYTPVTMQLFTMNADGSEVEAIAPMTLGSALHPFQLADGRIAFSTFESQGLRDSRLWGYWTIWEDGTHWDPLVSAFGGQDTAIHFASQLSNGDVVAEGYYNLNNEGFGWLFKFPAISPTEPVRFGSPFVADAAGGLTITVPGASGQRSESRWPFQPIGATAVTPFTHPFDREAPQVSGLYQGKVTHPSGAPNNDLLLVWSPGPVNSNGTHLPWADAGIYLARNGYAATPGDLVLVKNDPRFQELWPRAVVPYRTIYGVDEPRRLPVNRNDGNRHQMLPAGSPYGIVGTASVFQRESFPGGRGNVNYDGLEPFAELGEGNSNWISQGSDAGLYSNDDIGAVRIVTLEGRSAKTAPLKWRVPTANERMRVLGEGAVNPDGSFAAKIPADTPFTFQLLDKGGRVLTTAQTWHQVRPGEVRVDCGGCHLHSTPPLDFATSIAASLAPTDLSLAVAHDVEFIKDIRPILQAKCARCHNAAGPAPRLDSTALTRGTAPDSDDPLPLDYAVLARNAAPSHGGPRAMRGQYKLPNASRWVRLGQSRRSLLQWTLTGRRLDGWTNDRWPTESVPGDIGTLPGGTANAMWADVDFRVDHSALVNDVERRTFAAWTDLFAPIDLGGGFFVDETRPALTAVIQGSTVIVGAADSYSGVDVATLEVRADDEILSMASEGDGRWSGVWPPGARRLTARVMDRAGNLSTISRAVSVSP